MAKRDYKKLVVGEGQNIIDICVQHYGTAERLFDLLDTNPDLLAEGGITPTLEPGREVKLKLIETGTEASTTEQRTYAARATQVATGSKLMDPASEEFGEFNNDFSDAFA